MVLHFFQKLLRDGEAGAFSNDRIDPAVRAHRRAVFITGIIIDQPILDLRRVEDPAAVKAPTDRIPLERFHVIAAELVRFNIIFHKTYPVVMAPRFHASANFIVPAHWIIGGGWAPPPV